MYTVRERRATVKAKRARIQKELSTELGRTLRAVRGDLTLRAAAERIGTEHSTVSDLEKGKRRPDFETLVGISRGFGVPLEELVRMAGRDAGLQLPEDPTPYHDLAVRLAARSVAFPDLAKILDRLSGTDPVAYRSFLLMLDLWDRQDGEQR